MGIDRILKMKSLKGEPHTFVIEVRHSLRTKRIQCYSPSLHYLLLIDNGEPKCYDEVIQVEDSVKWESAMKDETR